VSENNAQALRCRDGRGADNGCENGLGQTLIMQSGRI